MKKEHYLKAEPLMAEIHNLNTNLQMIDSVDTIETITVKSRAGEVTIHLSPPTSKVFYQALDTLRKGFERSLQEQERKLSKIR